MVNCVYRELGILWVKYGIMSWVVVFFINEKRLVYVFDE